jgi:ADP-heptose:LPS heptosyltransferase
MNILLVRLRLIGDVVFTTPAVRAIRRRYPHARIAYLVEEEAAAVVRGNPHIDDLIVASSPTARGRLRADLGLARRLRRARYDLAIDFHGGPRSSLLTWATGAPTRLGFDVTGRAWMYTARVHRPRVLRPRHAVENQWDLLVPLGIPAPDPTHDPVEMPEDPRAAEAAHHRLAAAGVTPAHTMIVVHVSAGNPFRRWPAAAFTDLICRLALADSQRRIVVTSGPSEAEAAGAIAAEARARLGAARQSSVPHCGEFTVAELRAVIARAALFIGGDSGPAHVASTTRVPIVTIYGPTEPYRSRPWRDASLVDEAAEPGPLACRPCDQRRCEPGDFRCLSGVASDEVAACAERAMMRAGRSLAAAAGRLGA